MTFEVNVFSRSAAEICLHLNLRNRLIRALVCFLPQLPAERRETLGTAWGRLFPPLLTELIRSHRQSAIAAALLKPRGISLQVRSEWVGASLCVWWLQGVVWHHSPYCVHSSSAGSRSLTHSHTHHTLYTHGFDNLCSGFPIPPTNVLKMSIFIIQRLKFICRVYMFGTLFCKHALLIKRSNLTRIIHSNGVSESRTAATFHPGRKREQTTERGNVSADWHSVLFKQSVRRKIMCIPIIYIYM